MKKTWEQAREKVRRQVTRLANEDWLLSVFPVEIDEDSSLVLAAPSEEIQNVIRDRYYVDILNAVKAVDNSIRDVSIVCYAQEFFRHFVEMTKEQIPLALYQGDGHSFTVKIVGIINSIISDVFKLSHQNEYYRIDAIGWQQRKEEVSEQANAVGLNPYLWDMKIAVEHENDVTDWSGELIKLAHIRCNLKVIIGYSRYNERDRKEQEKLAYAAECLHLSHTLDDTAQESYLIILGNARSCDNNYQNYDYRGYLYSYKTGVFEQI